MSIIFYQEPGGGIHTQSGIQTITACLTVRELVF